MDPETPRGRRVIAPMPGTGAVLGGGMTILPSRRSAEGAARVEFLARQAPAGIGVAVYFLSGA